MTEGMIWFVLVAGSILIFIVVSQAFEFLTRRNINRMTVEAITNGNYTPDEISRIVEQWAADDATEG